MHLIHTLTLIFVSSQLLLPATSIQHRKLYSETCADNSECGPNAICTTNGHQCWCRMGYEANCDPGNKCSDCIEIAKCNQNSDCTRDTKQYTECDIYTGKCHCAKDYELDHQYQCKAYIKQAYCWKGYIDGACDVSAKCESDNRCHCLNGTQVDSEHPSRCNSAVGIRIQMALVWVALIVSIWNCRTL